MILDYITCHARNCWQLIFPERQFCICLMRAQSLPTNDSTPVFLDWPHVSSAGTMASYEIIHGPFNIFIHYKVLFGTLWNSYILLSIVAVLRQDRGLDIEVVIGHF